MGLPHTGAPKLSMADERLLALLKRHSPRSLPLTGKRYGGYDLKSRLDARKNGWLLMPRQHRQELFKRLSYLRPWLLAASKRRMAQGSIGVYDARSFSAAHESFKEKTLEIFTTSALKHVGARANVIIMDDFARRGQQLRTASRLLRKWHAKRIYLPNPDKRVIAAGKRLKICTSHSLLQEACKKEWSEISFNAAYLDSTSGSLTQLRSLIGAVLPRCSTEPFYLGVSIVGRCSAPGQGSVLERIAGLTDYLAGHGLQLQYPTAHGFLSFQKVTTLFYARD